ncbi:MAG: hypothetical protein LBT13_07250 [Treponema sp.]|jgi:hypothetical protein|nr:hypothetical protein [Treponema sp.]
MCSLWIAVVFAVSVALSGCATRYNFMAGISGLVEEYYAMYPSIEVDLALVTESETDDIKAAGVEDYFAPDSMIRGKIAPFTMFFSDENTVPVSILPKDEMWFKWMKKKPRNLMLIASLPPEADPPSPDPRMLFVPVKKKVPVQNMYFEIEPKKVSQIAIKPTDPQPKPPANTEGAGVQPAQK